MNRALTLAALLPVVFACHSEGEQVDEDKSPSEVGNETVCPEAEARLGYRVCVHKVPDEATWEEVTYPARAVDQERVTTYMVPAREESRLAPLLVDAGAFEAPEESLHYKFLTSSFPELSLLTYEEYLDLVLPSRREWFAGSVTEFIAVDEAPLFGFTVWDLGADPASTITCAEFEAVYEELSSRIGVGAVAAVPTNDLQREALEGCKVPVHDPATALDYEVYTRAKGCGTVRRYTLAELAAAEAEASFGWQDILVTDEAPLDIETIISGIVTGTRQGELSHLNVRSAGRGTPNCYIKGAYDLFEEWEGKLVRLECGADQATVEEITPEEAETCWEGFRPDPIEVTPADAAWTDLVGLLDLPTTTADERRAGVGRFGSKGANLAVLYQRIDPALQLLGFLIPFHYYDAFMSNNVWSTDLGSGGETLTFAETIDRYLDDSDFMSDGALRRERLAALQAAMEVTPCDPALIAAIEASILDTFGADDVMVRFRSSSNAEDSLDFNGAGLYNSTSVCLADEIDGDDIGPSRCDQDHANERSVCRGLNRVWSSLWNMKAFEEREWYGIDQRAIAMGILVDTRSKDEQANIVAFSGNPLLRGDPRYLVNAQIGELDVVSAEPGVWPEKDLLTVEDGGVALIERITGATELPEGEWVLTDARLRELGAALAGIVDVYPIDEEVPITVDVILDTEWKVTSDGNLIVKQVRPFLN